MSLLNVFLAVVAIGALLAIWSAWIEPRRIRRKAFDVPLRGLTQPLCVVIAGDLQPNNFHWPASRLKSLFAGIAKDEKPDIVLWLGDYYNAHTDMGKVVMDANPRLKTWVDQHLPPITEIADAMAVLKGRLGTVSILGNHDWAWSGAQTEAALAEVGIQVLKDEVVVLGQGDEQVQIVGYEDIASGRMPAFASVNAHTNPDLPTITLSHTPDAFPLDTEGSDLMLSGHSHGGQVRLPFFGPILLPLENPEFDRGWFQRDHRRLFVTSGIGTSLPPLRFLCPPEYVVFNLVPEKE